MVSNEIFTTYMISTTLAIILLGIMCIKNIKRDIELLELIEMVDKKHMIKENLMNLSMLEDIENEK